MYRVTSGFGAAHVSICRALCLGSIVTACGPKDEDESTVKQTCEGASDHYATLSDDDLGEIFAEQFRQDCAEMEEDFFRREIRCVADASSCPGALECAGSVEFVCDTNDHCSGGTLCDTDESICVSCLSDADCTEGRRCDVSGLCLSEDNQLLVPRESRP